MILFPSAKINIGLNVLFKRTDGFHELETCMVNIPYYDILEIIPADYFSFKQTGILVDCPADQNLCIRAFKLMEAKHQIPPVYMHLHKQIPMGGGLGGGSSDASYVLKGLNDLFGLKLSEAELEEYAAELGSDCPFFIKNIPQLAKGRGEVLSDVRLDLKGFYVKLINIGIHVSTQEAYAGVNFNNDKSNVDLEVALEDSVENWMTTIKNDFEKSVFAKHPQLKSLKEKLIDEGALYAAMTGSGSTLFALYRVSPPQTLKKGEGLEWVGQFN
jgi:4-diphosphocytidyl-2-C-methyl-D-erythritol kinase